MKTKLILIGMLLAGLAVSMSSYTNKSNVLAFETTTEIQTPTAESLFKLKCSACHLTTKPENMKSLIAPPMMGVMKHLKSGIDGVNETEKRKNVIDFIIDYTQYPSAEKSIFGAHAIERFDVMPSQKGNVNEEELTQIANYLYDNFPAKKMGKGKMGKKKKGSCGSGCCGKCEH